MNCCKSSQCLGVEKVFSTKFADRDLESYHEEGPSKETRALIDVIKQEGVEDASLLDIGGGIGAIQHELKKIGVEQIVNVDASPAYSHVAQQEAGAQGYAADATYHVGNFVDFAPDIAPVDIVTLDRVICCFDDMPALVGESSKLAKKIYGVIFPRDVWYAKLGVAIGNTVLWILRNPFRIFIHPTDAVEEIVRQNGFTRVFHEKGIFWQVLVYTRA